MCSSPRSSPPLFWSESNDSLRSPLSSVIGEGVCRRSQSAERAADVDDSYGLELFPLPPPCGRVRDGGAASAYVRYDQSEARGVSLSSYSFSSVCFTLTNIADIFVSIVAVIVVIIFVFVHVQGEVIYVVVVVVVVD